MIQPRLIALDAIPPAVRTRNGRVRLWNRLGPTMAERCWFLGDFALECSRRAKQRGNLGLSEQIYKKVSIWHGRERMLMPVGRDRRIGFWIDEVKFWKKEACLFSILLDQAKKRVTELEARLEKYEPLIPPTAKAPAIEFHGGPLAGELPVPEDFDKNKQSIYLGFEDTTLPDVKRVIPYFPIGDLIRTNEMCETPHVVAQYVAMVNLAFHWDVKEHRECDEPKKPKKEKKDKPKQEQPKQEKKPEEKKPEPKVPEPEPEWKTNPPRDLYKEIVIEQEGEEGWEKRKKQFSSVAGDMIEAPAGWEPGDGCLGTWELQGERSAMVSYFGSKEFCESVKIGGKIEQYEREIMKNPAKFIDDPAWAKDVADSLKAGYSLCFIDRTLDQKLRAQIPGGERDHRKEWNERVPPKLDATAKQLDEIKAQEAGKAILESYATPILSSCDYPSRYEPIWLAIAIFTLLSVLLFVLR